jgi:site-specific recombinase XerD
VPISDFTAKACFHRQYDVVVVIQIALAEARALGEGQATVYGKGGKTRVALISPTTSCELSALKGEAGPDAPVFVSRSKRHRLTTIQVWRIVRAAARQASAMGNVSPRRLRHAAASHALDAGPTLATVRDGLGHSSAATTSRYLHAKPRDGLARYLKV